MYLSIISIQLVILFLVGQFFLCFLCRTVVNTVAWSNRINFNSKCIHLMEEYFLLCKCGHASLFLGSSWPVTTHNIFHLSFLLFSKQSMGTSQKTWSTILPILQSLLSSEMVNLLFWHGMSCIDKETRMYCY